MKNNLKILYVTDNSEYEQLLRHKLSSIMTNYTMTHISDLKDLQSLLSDISPHIIISEYPLNNITNLLHFVKSFNTFIPVILLSEPEKEPEVLRLTETKAFDYLLYNNLTRLPLVIKNALSTSQLKNRPSDSDDNPVIQKINKRLNFALQCIETGAWELDLQKLDYWRSFEHDNIFGYDKPLKEWTFEIFLEHVVQEDRDDFNLKFQTAISTGKDWIYECRIKRADGEIRWIKIQGVLDFNKRNEPVKMFGVVQDITNQKLAENALKESEKKFKKAVTCSPIPIMLHDEDGNILMLSRGWTKYSGYSIDDITTISDWSEKAFGAPAVSEKQYINKLFETNETIDYGERVVKAKNGTNRIWQTKTTPLGDNSGGRRLLQSVAVDITEQKKAESELRERENKFKSLYENAPLSYQSLNKDGVFIDVNPMWLKTLGYKRDEVIGAYYKDFLHPDWASHFEKNFPAFKKRGYVSDVQFKIRHKKGHYIDISFEGCIGYNRDGSFRQTYCVFQDITSKKLAEEKLRESEEKYRLLHENAGLGIGYYDTKGNIISFNSIAAKDMNGIPEDFKGKSITDIFPGEMARFYLNRIQKAIESDKITSYEDFVTLPKQEKWFLSTYTKIVNSKKDIIGIQIISQNITELKNAEQKLLKSLKEKETLLQELYHRTKNNMQVILSMIKMNAEKYSGIEVKELVANIENKIQSISLVHQMLYKSKDLSHINAKTYIKELTSLLLRGYSELTEKVSIKIDIEEIMLLIDTAIPLGLVINELVINSLKYAFPGKQGGSIKISLKRINSEKVRLSISDNGIGVPDGFNLKSQDSLGLILVSGLVEKQMGGHIELINRKGLTFQIEISDSLYSNRV